MQVHASVYSCVLFIYEYCRVLLLLKKNCNERFWLFFFSCLAMIDFCSCVAIPWLDKNIFSEWWVCSLFVWKIGSVFYLRWAKSFVGSWNQHGISVDCTKVLQTEMKGLFCNWNQWSCVSFVWFWGLNTNTYLPTFYFFFLFFLSCLFSVCSFLLYLSVDSFSSPRSCTSIFSRNSLP